MNQENRRFEKRFSLELQAKITYPGEMEKNPQTELTTTANISSSGAYLLTSLQCPLASKLVLEFLVSYEDLKKLKFILSVESIKAMEKEKVWVKASGVVIRKEENGLVIIFDEDYTLTPMKSSE